MSRGAHYRGDPLEEEVRCAVCCMTFANRAEYIPHATSAWHQANTKRMMMGKKILSEEEWVKEFGVVQAAKPEDKPAVKVEVVPTPATLEVVKDAGPPPGENEVDACIVFDYRGERWNHMFRIPKGCTVLDLKRAMIKEDSPEDDVMSFDLHRRRLRVNNYDTIDETDTFEFCYLGPDEGLKKKDRDLEMKTQRVEQAKQLQMRDELNQREKDQAAENAKEHAEAERKKVELKDKQKREEEEKAVSSKPVQSLVEEQVDPEEDPPDDESGSGVLIYIHHLEADPLKGKTLTVTVPSTVSVRYLRRAVCNKIGRADIEAVTLHKKGGSYSQWPRMQDVEPVGTSREFFARGADLLPAASPLQRAKAAVKAAPAPKAASSATKTEEVAERKVKGFPAPKGIPGGLCFVVRHDTSGDVLEVCVAKGKTVLDLKRAVCERVLRGPYTRVVLADSKGNPLLDKDPLDKMLLADRERLLLAGIEICLPVSIELRVVHAADPEKVATITLDDTSSVADVKKALLDKYRGKPADVKIVMAPNKAGAPVASMADGMRLNGKRELYGTGKLMDGLPAPLMKAPAAVSSKISDLNVTIFIDREMGLSTPFKLKPGSCVADLRHQIAMTDATGNTIPEKVELQTASGGAAPDGELIVEGVEYTLLGAFC